MEFKGPLAGIKVLDFTVYQNGPSATQQLAEQGAEVLKVEPLDGEPNRHLAGRGKFNAGWENFNRGKRSIALDLKKESSMDIVQKLVEWADVVVENFRGPSVMNRLGLTYDQCKAWNESIIYASNSGFGEQGDWADRPSYDMVAQAFTGVMTTMGGGPSHSPTPVEWAFSDEVGAMNVSGLTVRATHSH